MDKFYAVAGYLNDEARKRISLFEIQNNANGSVDVKRIAIIPERDFRLNDFLITGSCLAIRFKKGIHQFDRTNFQRIDDVNPLYHGARSAPIVGLFESEEQARGCFNSSDLKHWDSRFIDESERVILKIGVTTDHAISLDQRLATAVANSRLRELLLSH